ncbi:MAG: hydrolase [Oscillospiraceae bacterium]|jgi:hypothetical protein|nr:hydrolase [Oscillospiraceae bacterium]
MKEKFIKIFEENIKRDGAEQLLAYLNSSHSDFFTAPCSTRFHGSYPGGLVEHSVNVYNCLVGYAERVKLLAHREYSMESLAIVSLLHDICKTNLYKKGFRNVKNEDTGKWEKVPSYDFDDTLPFGHGEKSQYIIAGFMKLTRDESFAIRYHMGFSNVQTNEERNNVGKSFEMFPLAFALSVADMEATYFVEGSLF